ncbi:MAG: single-stranded-DNA-specific exonuclease RecJ, partial [Clostridia bacterium]|nr:single-stranded-DNA-specific exonuclease RecJ [Clostridia bacterium]
MVIKYARALSEKELGIAGEISARCGVSPDTARLLLYRGIDDANKAQRFLSPSAKYFYDPFSLGGVKEAVERITLARDKNEKALVFGDYDADGICAATVLSACLEEFGV